MSGHPFSDASSRGKRRRANRRFMQYADHDWLRDVAADARKAGAIGLAADLAAGRWSYGSLDRAYAASGGPAGYPFDGSCPF